MKNNKNIIKRSKIFSHRNEELFLEEIELKPGVRRDYVISQMREYVVIVPFISNEKIIMLEQYRPGVKRKVLGFPAGFLEKGESPIDAAKRELYEETGYRAKKVELVQMLYENAARSRNPFYIALASGLSQEENVVNPDLHESVIYQQIVSRKDLLSLKLVDRILSANTLAVLPFIANK